jgi:hypothetical protein
MVKFTSPQEFYDWYNANRAELLAFHSAHKQARHKTLFIEAKELDKYEAKDRYWTHFSPNFPVDKKQEVMEEDEIYIVSNVNGFRLRNEKWWVIYIPNSLYKVNHSISNPFEKEAWWYYRQGESEHEGHIATPDLEWISGFIKYEGETPYRGSRCLNYPEGGI